MHVSAYMALAFVFGFIPNKLMMMMMMMKIALSVMACPHCLHVELSTCRKQRLE